MLYDKHKTICSLGGILMLIVAGMSQAAQPDRAIKKDYSLQQLSKHVYVIQGPIEDPNPENQAFRNNPGIVLTEEGAVVIDPGSSVYVGEMVVRKVRSLTDKPIVAVFDTHAHGDHWLGNEGIKLSFPRAVIYAHPKMMALPIKEEGMRWLKAFNALSNNAVQGTTPVGPDVAVKDGQVIKIGGMQFRMLLPGPAHSDTDIMIEIPSEKVLFFGDIVRDGLLGPFMSSFKGNIAAIDRGLASGAKIFVPGHGRSGDAKVAKTYRRFLVTMREQVRKNYHKGKSDFEMKPDIEKALADYRNWVSFDASIGKLISIAYSEIEQEEF